jgi:5'-3' exonuclease
MSNTYDNIIIDGNNLLYRAFYVKRPCKFVNNVNVAPVEQFLYMIKSVCIKFKPKNIFLTWDKKLNPERKNFRKDLLAYKEQRVENEKTEELLNNIQHIQKFIDCLGIKTIYPKNTEADDVIRYLSITYNNSLIISNDRDLLQLIRQSVDVYLPDKDRIVCSDNFQEINGVEQKHFVLYKSIKGDVSDNIDGLYKFGPVRAKILAEKILVDSAVDFSKAELSKDQIEIIERNLKVIDLSYIEQAEPDEYSNFKQQDENCNVKFDIECLKNLFKEYHFIKFLNGFSEWSMIFNTSKDEKDLLSFISL